MNPIKVQEVIVNLNDLLKPKCRTPIALWEFMSKLLSDKYKIVDLLKTFDL